jgi:hypothetical protein
MKKHEVRISVLLEPIGSPMIRVSCGGNTKTMRSFNSQSWIDFKFEQEDGPARLSVELFDKLPHDSTTAVIVKQIKLNDIEHLQNTYQGMYYPHNMESKRDTYLAWNGVWTLDFTVPVYTWMHKTQGLGWIYD